MYTPRVMEGGGGGKVSYTFQLRITCKMVLNGRPQIETSYSSNTKYYILFAGERSYKRFSLLRGVHLP